MSNTSVLGHTMVSTLLVTTLACNTPTSPPTPGGIEVVQGVPALSTPGQKFDTISVRVTTTAGEPLRGWSVAWSGDGEVDAIDSVTDALGMARAIWTLPRFMDANDYNPIGPSGDYNVFAEMPSGTSARISTTARAFIVDDFDAAWVYGCGLRSGKLWCWGNLSSPLNDQVRARSPRRVPIPDAVDPIDVTTVTSVICLRGQASDVWCSSPALGGEFRPIPDAPPMSSLTGGDYGNYLGTIDLYLCGLSTIDQTPWCLEGDENSPPAAVHVNDVQFTGLATGQHFGCGVKADHTVWCWGRNDHHQLGNGTSDSTDTPTPVAGGHDFIEVVAGPTSACATGIDLKVYCWGKVAYNQENPTPQLVDAPGVRGPELFIGNQGEGYALVDNTLEFWLGDESLFMGWHLDNFWPIKVRARGDACMQVKSGELYCSFTMLTASAATTTLPTEVIPVPNPDPE